jgi:putative tryptophan/tyrosine transport system substrate-binding protein
VKRREFIGLLGGATAWPLSARAQQSTKVYKIGILSPGSPEPQGATTNSPNVRVLGWIEFSAWLRELGWNEGENIVLEYRYADNQIGRLSSLAAELVQLKVDVIVAGATPGARAASRATTTIPIVAPAMGDPVGDGLVASLARPGGNITGSTFLGPELVPKRLELLKEALPKASQVAVLWHPNAFGEHTMRDMLADTRAAARAQGLELQFLEVRDASDFEQAFSSITRAEALLVFPSVMLFSERSQIADQAAKLRLPLFSVAREFTELGGLMSYGANIGNLMQRAASYVDKILKGAHPADLPIEQPTKFELVVNVGTAKALGLTIPQSILLRADEVIE